MKARHEFNTEQEWLEYIRCYFAAMAMQGMLAAFSDSYHASPENTAQLAVKYADALIEQLNK